MKSGNLNFLEPSGPLQACNRADLPLPLVLNIRVDVFQHHEYAAAQAPGLRDAVMRQTAVHVQRLQKRSKWYASIDLCREASWLILPKYGTLHGRYWPTLAETVWQWIPASFYSLFFLSFLFRRRRIPTVHLLECNSASVLLYLCMKQFQNRWTYFHDICYLWSLLRFVDIFHFQLE